MADYTECHTRGIWVTGDQRQIPVTEMTDEHLLKVAKLLVQRARERSRRQYFMSLRQMAQAADFLQGDMAVFSVESEMTALQEEETPDGNYHHILTHEFPFWTHLEAEAHRRNLHEQLFQVEWYA